MKTFNPVHRLVVAGLVLGVSSGLVAQEGRGLTRSNLDLPYDAFSAPDSDEEAPELIYFYGQQYEGDGFFFCLDRSSSTRNGELEIEQRETVRSITQFSSRVEFAVVFYDQSVRKWPASGQPARATEAMKSAGISWVLTMKAGRGSCVREGLLQALNYANRSSAERNVVIYLGDGGTTCPGQSPSAYAESTLSAVASANREGHQINAVCVGNRTANEDFCRQIAAIGKGTYRRIQR